MYPAKNLFITNNGAINKGKKFSSPLYILSRTTKNGNTGDVYLDDQRNRTQEDLIQIFSTFPNFIVNFDFLIKYCRIAHCLLNLQPCTYFFKTAILVYWNVHLEIKDIFVINYTIQVDTLKWPFHCTKKTILRVWVHGRK